MTPGPDLQQLIDTIRHDADSDDVLDQLAAAASTITELTSTGDAALGYFVDRARGSGRSWVEISSVLGVSKQAAHKRFADSWANKPAEGYYTARTVAVLEAAREIARGLNHPFIGTEHLLLAFYSQPKALATRILLAHGITEDAVRAAVVSLSPARDPRDGATRADTDAALDGDHPPYTRRTAHVLQGAAAEALVLGHNYVGTEHLLLAFYRDSAGVATKVLQELGLDESTAWTAIRAELERLTKAQ